MPGVLIKEGSFSTVKKTSLPTAWIPSEFFSCRERFQNYSKGLSRVIFTHRSSCGPNIAAFVECFEKKLNLAKHSVFGPTQRNDVTWLCVDSWWVRSEVRRSLYTALLRVGQNYKPKKDNFEATLFANCYGRQNYYTRQTRRAVERFLEGYTSLSRHCGFVLGWWDCFCENEWSSGERYKLLTKQSYITQR
jgi:hypothetical protein